MEIKVDLNRKISQELLTELSHVLVKLKEIDFDAKQLTNKEKDTLCLLQNYWCHNHYILVVKNENKSQLYDNCMNLILVISSKLASDEFCANNMLSIFIDHLSLHQGCFNYIISFYRLYSNSDLIKSLSRERNLINYLFEFYKYLYMSCYFLEFVDKSAFEDYFITEEEEDEMILNYVGGSENDKGKEKTKEAFYSGESIIKNSLFYCDQKEKEIAVGVGITSSHIRTSSASIINHNQQQLHQQKTRNLEDIGGIGTGAVSSITSGIMKNKTYTSVNVIRDQTPQITQTNLNKQSNNQINQPTVTLQVPINHVNNVNSLNLSNPLNKYKVPNLKLPITSIPLTSNTNITNSNNKNNSIGSIGESVSPQKLFKKSIINRLNSNNSNTSNNKQQTSSVKNNNNYLNSLNSINIIKNDTTGCIIGSGVGGLRTTITDRISKPTTSKYFNTDCSNTNQRRSQPLSPFAPPFLYSQPEILSSRTFFFVILYDLRRSNFCWS